MPLLFPFSSDTGDFVFSGATGLIIERSNEISSLLRKGVGQLASIDPDLHRALFAKASSIQEIPEKLPIKALTVFITNKCNLNCSYCYHHNCLDEQKHLSLENLKRTLDLVSENIGFSDQVAISFFGGEPLTEPGLINDACSLLDLFFQRCGIKPRYSVTTNGTLISDTILELLIKKNMNITVSFDGFRKLHDTYRVFKDTGKGSFSIVKNNLAQFSKYLPVTIRPTLFPRKEFLDLIYLDRMAKKVGASNLLVNLVSTNNSNKKSDLAKVKESIANFCKYAFECFRNKEAILLSNLLLPLKEIHFGLQSLLRFPCQAGGPKLALSVDGRLHICHRFVTEQGFEIISYGNKRFIDKRLTFLWSHSIENRGKKCNNCWMRFYCGGDCYHTSLNATGSSASRSDLHCLWRKEMMKGALVLYTKLSSDELNFLENTGSAASFL